ncbi:MAG: hypothetical protein V4641_20810, partial [Pseudomonadota bacterium]
DDDVGHARLIEKNLKNVGLHNPVQRCENGQEVLDFLFRRGPGPHPRSAKFCQMVRIFSLFYGIGFA